METVHSQRTKLSEGALKTVENRGGKATYLGTEILGENTESAFMSCATTRQGKQRLMFMLPSSQFFQNLTLWVPLVSVGEI